MVFTDELRRWSSVTRRLCVASLSLVLVSACAAPIEPADGGDSGRFDASVDSAREDIAAPDVMGSCPDMDNDGHRAATCGGDDCDDLNPRRNPGAREVCDSLGTDEDCDPCTVSEVSPTNRGGDGDTDEDGFVSNQCFNRIGADAVTPVCNSAVSDAGARAVRVQVGDGEVRGTDCADNATNGGTRFPGATEQCNNLDDNCDGMIDETPGLRSTYFRDRDGDGFGDRGAIGADVVLACTRPAGFVSLNTDCNDTNAMVSPGAREVCDPMANVDENCNGTAEEGCGCPSVGASRACCSGRGTETCTMSGAGSVWGSCTAMVSAEVCDGVDNNCDGTADEGLTILCYPDGDNDGFAATGATTSAVCPDPMRVSRGMCPMNYTRQAPTSAATTDCNDLSMAQFPGNVESCNGVDDNCNLTVDEGLRRTYYRDADGDGFGDRSAMGGDVVSACAVPMGYSLNNTDCNDANAMVSPGAREVCDPMANVDENCNGVAEEGCGCPSVGASRACCSGRGTETCTMSGAGSVWGSCTAAVSSEVCDGLDNDCDGTADEGLTILCYVDGDGDGFALAGAATRMACPVAGRPASGGCPMGLTARAPSSAVDCDDANANRFPTNPERCDNIDNDCDGVNDEGICADATVDSQGGQTPPRGFGYCVTTPTGPACEVRTCTSGFANCDNNARNGCEASLRTDSNNCGACGNRCSSGLCVGGICTATATSVVAGTAHACVLFSSGAVACWGRNGSGQLGDGTTMARSTPTIVPGLTDAVEVAAGGNHTCARRAGGTVVCWGANASGQLGNGTMTPSAIPVPVTGLSDAAQLSVNGANSCARRAGGTVVCWGANANGQLGDGTITPRTTPVAAMGLTNVAQLSVGGTHACAVRNDGALWCWGSNSTGQTGTPAGMSTVRVPTVVNGFGATKVAAGERHTCVLRTSRVVACFGDNLRGQVGANLNDPTVRTPTNVMLSNVVDVETEFNHVCALQSNGTMSCWGENTNFQLGLDSGLRSRELAPATSPEQIAAVQLATGATFTCGRWGGRVFCLGDNSSGQLGDGNVGANQSSRAVRSLGTSVDLSAGVSHTCASTGAGQVACWGSTASSETGYPDRPLAGRTVPTLSDASRVSNGGAFSCALSSTGAVSCWGDNTSGQLGDGTTTARTSPVAVTGLTDAVELEVGRAFACARRASGAVVCWGANVNGQLGNGTTAPSSTPVMVTGLTSGALELSVGQTHACARRADHRVVCWGANAQGQLGDATTIQRTAPVLVTAIQEASDVAAGGSFTCARLFSDNSVWCWGANDTAQLGRGNYVAAIAPARSMVATDTVELRAGDNFACARRSSGAVLCWGQNANGQLGNGTRTQGAVPTTVGSLTNAVGIELGSDHACARTAALDTLCWGANPDLRLGSTSPFAYVSSPSRVFGM